MHDFPHLSNRVPPAGNADQLRLGLEKWQEAVASREDAALTAFARDLEASPAAQAFLTAVFGNSPFLTQAIVQDPIFAMELLSRGWDAVFPDILENLATLRREGPGEADMARKLRIAKRRMALTVGAADISGSWPVEQVTRALSDFADAAISAAIAHLLRQSAASGALELADPEDPERESGLVILGMGKLGARDLNYSSDVDLIILFDAEKTRVADPDQILNVFVRLTRNLVKLLEERTRDGYVFRTDLRLRPDPASTPPALSVMAAELYYESLGQNWERAAMIKARPVAGDIAAGDSFLQTLQPYIWRKYLDFAAIQDIHSIKRQIDAHRGGGRISVPGHNVKLGRGGIREIEFFVQTQQLIWGGRQPELRLSGTLDALRALAEIGHVEDATAADMAESYRFLRRVEHHIQMVNDEQNHSVPADRKGIAELAAFLGFESAEDFAAELQRHLKQVETHYAHLFEDAPQLSADGGSAGNLVFTGGEPDPDTIATLAKFGYRSPETADSTVRGWHHGRYRAMRSARARELLTELMPKLLAELARNPDPDAALRNFDTFLSGLPAGVQLFSMFYANPHLLELVAEIMGGAPRLAQHLSRKPTIMDNVLSGDFFDAPPSAEALFAEISRNLERCGVLEEALDIARRWAHDRQFQAGVQMLRGYLTPRAASAVLSNIADAALKALWPVVEADFARTNGRFPGAGMLCMALGKLGSREMTPTSDLDLILVYDVPEGIDASDGPKPLAPSQYYARLTQRLINAVTAQTAEGTLFEVDMRLRPSGAKGPIASSLEAFVLYHERSAWTWEHMALSRARIIFGSDELSRRVGTIVRETLTRPRDPEALLRDVADMRQRIDAEHHSDFPWEVKYIRGGLVDIDFIAQHLQLRHASDVPGVLSPNTRTALRALRDNGFLDAAIADDLVEALDLWQAVQNILRLTIEGRFTPDREGEITPTLEKTLAEAGGAPDIGALKAKMQATAERTYGHFRDLIESPAAALPPPPSEDGQNDG